MKNTLFYTLFLRPKNLLEIGRQTDSTCYMYLYKVNTVYYIGFQ